MIGAIIGDIAGSRFERASHKSKEFELFDKKCRPTDDSVMSLAIAKAVLDCEGSFEDLSQKAVSCMQELGRQYKNAGYGGNFYKWIWTDDPQPYNSYGNGSAMRISPCGFAASSLEEAKELSAKVTEVSHNHPEGMKGAEAIAVAIFLARSGVKKEEIREYILANYYEIGFTLDQIRKTYRFDVSCQGSVPVALEAFFESTDFEDAIRNAISVGGDSDTIAAITGSVAEAYYGVPEGIIDSVIYFLDSRQMEILYYFEKKYPAKAQDEDGEATLSVFEVIDESVDKVIPTGTPLRVDEEYPNGAVHAWVDTDMMQPDFSSFDKPDKIKEAKEMLTKTGEDISKTAKKAREGLFSAAKTVRETFDQTKAKVASKAVYCYEVAPEDAEDTEQIIQAVSLLKKEGFDARIYVSDGTMQGYVFAKGEDYQKAASILEPVERISLKEEPVSKALSELVKKHS